MRGANCILGIPNNNVREQYFNYLKGYDLLRLDQVE